MRSSKAPLAVTIPPVSALKSSSLNTIDPNEGGYVTLGDTEHGPAFYQRSEIAWLSDAANEALNAHPELKDGGIDPFALPKGFVLRLDSEYCHSILDYQAPEVKANEAPAFSESREEQCQKAIYDRLNVMLGQRDQGAFNQSFIEFSDFLAGQGLGFADVFKDFSVEANDWVDQGISLEGHTLGSSAQNPMKWLDRMKGLLSNPSLSKPNQKALWRFALDYDFSSHESEDVQRMYAMHQKPLVIPASKTDDGFVAILKSIQEDDYRNVEDYYKCYQMGEHFLNQRSIKDSTDPYFSDDAQDNLRKFFAETLVHGANQYNLGEQKSLVDQWGFFIRTLKGLGCAGGIVHRLKKHVIQGDDNIMPLPLICAAVDLLSPSRIPNGQWNMSKLQWLGAYATGRIKLKGAELSQVMAQGPQWIEAMKRGFKTLGKELFSGMKFYGHVKTVKGSEAFVWRGQGMAEYEPKILPLFKYHIFADRMINKYEDKHPEMLIHLLSMTSHFDLMQSHEDHTRFDQVMTACIDFSKEHAVAFSIFKESINVMTKPSTADQLVALIEQMKSLDFKQDSIERSMKTMMTWMQDNIGDCFPSGYLANEIVKYGGDNFDEQTKRQLSVMANGKEYSALATLLRSVKAHDAGLNMNAVVSEHESAIGKLMGALGDEFSPYMGKISSLVNAANHSKVLGLLETLVEGSALSDFSRFYEALPEEDRRLEALEDAIVYMDCIRQLSDDAHAFSEDLLGKVTQACATSGMNETDKARLLEASHVLNNHRYLLDLMPDLIDDQMTVAEIAAQLSGVTEAATNVIATDPDNGKSMMYSLIANMCDPKYNQGEIQMKALGTQLMGSSPAVLKVLANLSIEALNAHGDKLLKWGDLTAEQTALIESAYGGRPPYPALGDVMTWLESGSTSEDAIAAARGHLYHRSASAVDGPDFGFDAAEFVSQMVNDGWIFNDNNRLEVWRGVVSMKDAIDESLKVIEAMDLNALNGQLDTLQAMLADNGGTIEAKVGALCLTMEYLRRTTHQPYKHSLSDATGQPIQLGQELNTTQVMCNLLMLQAKEKANIQIGTGGGKSRISIVFAIIKALQGYCVDVVTSDADLCRRAFREYRPLIESMGLSVGVGIDLYAQGSGSLNFVDINTLRKVRAQKRHQGDLASIKGEKSFLVADEADALYDACNFVEVTELDKDLSPFVSAIEPLMNTMLGYKDELDDTTIAKIKQTWLNGLEGEMKDDLSAWLDSVEGADIFKNHWLVEAQAAWAYSDDMWQISPTKQRVFDHQGVEKKSLIPQVIEDGVIKGPFSGLKAAMMTARARIKNPEHADSMVMPGIQKVMVTEDVDRFMRDYDGYMGMSGTMRFETRHDEGVDQITSPPKTASKRREHPVILEDDANSMFENLWRDYSRSKKSHARLYAFNTDREVLAFKAFLDQQDASDKTVIHIDANTDDAAFDAYVKGMGQDNHITIATYGRVGRGVDTFAENMEVIGCGVPTRSQWIQFIGRTARNGRHGESVLHALASDLNGIKSHASVSERVDALWDQRDMAMIVERDATSVRRDHQEKIRRIQSVREKYIDALKVITANTPSSVEASVVMADKARRLHASIIDQNESVLSEAEKARINQLVDNRALSDSPELIQADQKLDRYREVKEFVKKRVELYKTELDEFKKTIQRDVRIAACKAKFIEAFRQAAQDNGFTPTEKDLGKVFHKLLFKENYNHTYIKNRYQSLSPEIQHDLITAFEGIGKAYKAELKMIREEDKISPAEKIEDFTKGYLEAIADHIEAQAQQVDVGLSEAAESFRQGGKTMHEIMEAHFTEAHEDALVSECAKYAQVQLERHQARCVQLKDFVTSLSSDESVSALNARISQLKAAMEAQIQATADKRQAFFQDQLAQVHSQDNSDFKLLSAYDERYFGQNAFFVSPKDGLKAFWARLKHGIKRDESKKPLLLKVRDQAERRKGVSATGLVLSAMLIAGGAFVLIRPDVLIGMDVFGVTLDADLLLIAGSVIVGVGVLSLVLNAVFIAMSSKRVDSINQGLQGMMISKDGEVQRSVLPAQKISDLEHQLNIRVHSEQAVDPSAKAAKNPKP